MSPRQSSSEELLKQAQANGYNQGAHREKYSIRDCFKYVEKWHDALRQQDHTPLPPLPSDGAEPPDLFTIKEFLRFHIALSRGRIDKQGRITSDSVCTFAEWFFAAFKKASGNAIDEIDRKAVYDWARTELVDEGLVSNIKKEKYLFGWKEWTRFNKTFWKVDDRVFVHPRNKVQIPFLISLFCWTGARIGTFFPNATNKDKAGLRYRDVELVLQRASNNSWKVIYKIDQRFVKNNRSPETTKYGVASSEHRNPLYDDTQYLLAMAMADKAIYGIDAPEDLWQQQIPPGENELVLLWRDEKLGLPIVRSATKAEGVSEQPLSKATFTKIIKDVCRLSGYYVDLTVHAIRRSLGQMVDGYFQSFDKFFERGLPVLLPAERDAAVRACPELAEMKSQIQHLKIVERSSKAIKKLEDQLRADLTKQMKNELETFQHQWVQERRR
ncbi:MAG: hypothetical protein MMC23_005391 [Stictis urceolatum]|nr:hypothetical protein [Stictis urceolata]